MVLAGQAELWTMSRMRDDILYVLSSSANGDGSDDASTENAPEESILEELGLTPTEYEEALGKIGAS